MLFCSSFLVGGLRALGELNDWPTFTVRRERHPHLDPERQGGWGELGTSRKLPEARGDMRWPAEQVAVNEPQAGGRSGRGRRAEGPSLMVAEGGGRKRCEKYTRGHTQSPSGPGTVTSVYCMRSCVLRGFRDTKIRDIFNPFPWDGGPEPSLAGKTDPVGGVQTALLCWGGRRCQRAQQVDLEAVPGAAPPAECGGERWAGSVAGKGMGRARCWVPCGWAGDPG